ncbi:hypothetical protein lerEdw1_007188 [Lerista edwardsae]|nr:hypothetical protein lerEdw1_007188 [Lerista edwardsae]
MEALSTANTGFALDLFKQVCKTQNNQNILFSPWSIYSILTAVYLGAKGQTAEQIAEVLHYSIAEGTKTTSPKRKARAYSKLEDLVNNPCIRISKAPLQRSSNIHSTFQALSQEINQPTKHFLLRSINQLYGDRSAPFQKEFLQSIKEYYNTEPKSVNFQEAAEEVREEINSWVESQTEGKIQDLLSKGSIDELTQLILVNALYFKGNWSKPFKKENTTEQPFRLNKSTSKPVKMMFQHDKFNWTYIKEVQTEILELPYVNNDLSMFILLPDDISDDSTGLEMLEKELTYEALSKWTRPEEMEEADVKVYLPRIQLDDGYELKSTLSSLGITDAFSPGHADFTGMSDRNDLVLAMDSLSISNGNFTLDLFKKLDQSFQGQNLFFSSWSISSALSMVCLGARNNTATEMARVLHFSAKETESSPSSQDLSQGEGIHGKFQKLLEEINQPKSTYLLKVANRLYGEKTFPFLCSNIDVISKKFDTGTGEKTRIPSTSQAQPIFSYGCIDACLSVFQEYMQLVKKYYHAEPQAVDFLRAAEEVRGQINAWVEKETNNKITNLLPQGAVDSRTALVLVNAIYFKGQWKTRFQKRNTTVMPFRLSKTKSKPVQMMFLKNKFRTFFVETLMVYILELPYVNDELSMFILLPEDITDDTTGLELLEKELTYERLSTWTSPEMMDQMEVEVYLPRIRLEENYDLRSTLNSMGMTDAFSQSRANFTGMSKENNLFLSAVYHKSFVEVNEEGPCYWAVDWKCIP